MTCIIGLVEDAVVYIGADSRRSRGTAIETALDSKIVRVGNVLIGVAGMTLANNLVAYKLPPPPECPLGASVGTHLFEHIITPLRRLAKEYDLDFSQCELVLGYEQRIYRVGPDFSLASNMDYLVAIGSGEEVALGAMCALKDTLPPKERIIRALEIAARLNDGIAPPYRIVTLPVTPEAAA